MKCPAEVAIPAEPGHTVAQAEAAGKRAFDFMGRAPFEPRPAAELLAEIAQPDLPAESPEPETHQPFGDWLLAEMKRKGWIGELSRAFQADRNFPKQGGPDQVRRYLRDVRAEGDAYEALDAAELDWAKRDWPKFGGTGL